MTESKKLLNVLNQYGHSISYTAAEEIEIELTYKATKENFLMPNDMKACKNTSVGLAFDNYDRYVKTFTGKLMLNMGVKMRMKTLKRLLFKKVNRDADMKQ